MKKVNILSDFKEFVQKNKLDLKNQTVVVGVSCGVDSMVLLSVLEQYEKIMDFKIVVCHVNHKRRAQSEIEEEFIKSYCLDKHELHILHFEETTEHISSFQEMARNKRLTFFKDTLKKVGGKYLFLAHHLNDDMETTYMHMIRGSSLESISGIKEITIANDIFIIRPFLRVLKMDIYQYAKDNNIVYYEDCTNNEDDYTRNRVRHNLIKFMFKENPNFSSNYINFKEKLEYSVKVMNEIRDNYIRENIFINNKEIKINRDSLFNLDIVMQKEVLFEILKKYSFSNNNINEILKIINTNKNQLIVNYKQICIIKEYDKIIIMNELYEKKETKIEIDEIGLYHLNEYYDLEIRLLKDEKNSKNTISNINTMWYNSNKFPFYVRNRKDGDKILLSNGHKKIKDLLIDLHVSLVDRDNALLLIDNNNDIISILGIKKSFVLSNSKENDIEIKLIRREKEK